MEKIESNGIVISVGDVVSIKNDDDTGVIRRIEKSGHFEENIRYALFIEWDDTPNQIIRTRIDYFNRMMETKTK